MRITLLAFASAGDALGEPRATMELADGTTVGQLRQLLSAIHPAFETLWPRLAVAIGGEIVGQDAVIPDGAEVALLPPVSGGCGR